MISDSLPWCFATTSTVFKQVHEQIGKYIHRHHVKGCRELWVCSLVSRHCCIQISKLFFLLVFFSAGQGNLERSRESESSFIEKTDEKMKAFMAKTDEKLHGYIEKSDEHMQSYIAKTDEKMQAFMAKTDEKMQLAVEDRQVEGCQLRWDHKPWLFDFLWWSFSMCSL